MRSDQVNELKIAFQAIRSWANSAECKLKRGTKRLPNTSALRRLFSKSHPSQSITSAKSKHYGGRQIIAFRTKQWPRLADRARRVWPAHFAILRALELVPGMRIFLNNDRNGKTTDPAKMIFNLSLRITQSKAKKLRIFGVTKLDRILFNVGRHAKIYERRGGNHQEIIPAHSVPIRSRPGKLTDRSSVIRAAEKLIGDNNRYLLPFTSEEMRSLLEDLFAISDTLHWDELLDRLPQDQLHKDLFPWSPRSEARDLLDWIGVQDATASLRRGLGMT